MTSYSFLQKTIFALAFTILIVGFALLANAQKGDSKPFQKGQNDSSAASNQYFQLDDNAFDQLDEQMQQLQINMKKLDEQMKNLDFSKMQKELSVRLKEIDFDKLSENMSASIESIDWKELNNHLTESRLQAEQIKEQMKNVKTDLEKQRRDLKFNSRKLQITVEKAMKEAKRSMEKAKHEMLNFKEFTNALEKDGLIDKSKAYTIQLKDGELYINDQKQPKEVSDKYRRYYKNGNLSITIDSDGTRI